MMNDQQNQTEAACGRSDSTEVLGFSVVRRNYGHWDVTQGGYRLFRLRGGPSGYIVLDERQMKKGPMKFKTVGACMAYICDELMFELIVAEGQNPHIVESWNIAA